MFDVFTIILSVFALSIAYLSLVSKKPRIYFKLTYIHNYNTDGCLMNINIVNCGDKPAFNIIIIPKFFDNDEKFDIEISKYINPCNENSEAKKKKNKNLKAYDECFLNKTRFISGNSELSKYIGHSSKDEGDFNKDFKVTADIYFEEEFIIFKPFNTILCKIDAVLKKRIVNNVLNFLTLSFLLITPSNSSILLIVILSITLILYNAVKKEIEEKGINYIFSYFDCELQKNDNKIIKVHEYAYEYAFADTFILTAIPYDNIKNNCQILFNDPLYRVWENSLTRDELKQFNKYRLEFKYDPTGYIELINKIDRTKKNIFYKKYVVFLGIMLELNFLDYEIVKKLKEILNENTK